MARVQHFQSATQLIELDGARILTDPWLTNGEYLGSWYHYPPFPKNEIEKLEYDYIYVSHIHPDHVCVETFKILPTKAPVIIHKFKTSFLKKKIESLGFTVLEIDNGETFKFNDNAGISIYAADNCDPELCGRFFGCSGVETDYTTTNIDTLALFFDPETRILNTNDCPWALARETIMANNLYADIDLLLVGYAGAGPYPQCFAFPDDESRYGAVKRKEEQFIQSAINFVDLVQPRLFMPFAGTYVLGGRLAHLNTFRGVPEIQDAADRISERIRVASKPIVLRQGAGIDLTTERMVETDFVYDPPERLSYMKAIEEKQYWFDDDPAPDFDTLSLAMQASYIRFKRKAEEIKFQSKTKILMSAGDDRGYLFSLDTPPEHVSLPAFSLSDHQPIVRIDVEDRLLMRLLKGPQHAHWNNAEIGSHIRFNRIPDTFERGLYHCLYFFHS